MPIIRDGDLPLFQDADTTDAADEGAAEADLGTAESEAEPDLSSRGQSLGSVAVREAVLRLKPALVVCGHIHGSAGERATLGSSTVINAGLDGVEWTLARRG